MSSREEEFERKLEQCDLDYSKRLTIGLIVVVVVLIALVLVMTILGLCGVFTCTKTIVAKTPPAEPDLESFSSLDHVQKVEKIGKGLYSSNKVLFDLNRALTASAAEYASINVTRDFFFHIAFMLRDIGKSTVLFTNSYQNLGQIILIVESGCLSLGVHGNTDHVLKTNSVLKANVNYLAQIVFSTENDISHLQMVVSDQLSTPLAQVEHPLPLGFEFTKDVFPLLVGGRIFEQKYYDVLEDQDIIYYISFSEDHKFKWSFTAKIDPVKFPLEFECSDKALELVWKTSEQQ